MSRFGYRDHCRKCKKLIPTDFAKTNCPICGVKKPVEPLSTAEEVTNMAAGLGFFFGGTFIFGLVILVAIVFLILMINFLN